MLAAHRVADDPIQSEATGWLSFKSAGSREGLQQGAGADSREFRGFPSREQSAGSLTNSEKSTIMLLFRCQPMVAIPGNTCGGDCS